MSKRGLDEEALLDVIETGTLIEKGNGHWWIHNTLNIDKTIWFVSLSSWVKR
ncbi:MAG: hypothetical protein IPN81_05250 [Nitrosomonadales bacterium]|nr:hypothetical protein [Nitrosomonadales bacterium]